MSGDGRRASASAWQMCANPQKRIFQLIPSDTVQCVLQCGVLELDVVSINRVVNVIGVHMLQHVVKCCTFGINDLYVNQDNVS